MVVRVVNSIFASIVAWVTYGMLETPRLFRSRREERHRKTKKQFIDTTYALDSLLLLGLTAGLFLYIMVLETFLTDSRLTARTFNMSVDELRKPALNTAMKNLGVYNAGGRRSTLCPLFFLPMAGKWRRCSSLLALSLRSTGLFLLNLASCSNKGCCLFSG